MQNCREGLRNRCIRRGSRTQTWPESLGKHLREGANDRWDRALDAHVVPVGRCRGSLLFTRMSRSHGWSLARWTLLFQGRRHMHSRGKVAYRLDDTICTREHFFPPCAWKPFSLLDIYHLWWLKNVDRYNDPAFHQNLYTKVNRCLPYLFLSFDFQFYVN